MFPDYHNRLEAAIDRELKALPEIPAPPTLILRVLRAIAQRQALPWFRRAWQSWPVSLRIVSFALLALLFSGLCFGAWNLSTAGFAVASQRYGSIFSSLYAAITAVFGSLAAAVNQVPKAVLIGCAAAVVFGYTMGVALGTACFALVRNVHRFQK